ncbi:MAG: SixA phosphatase family protein [Runella sp.]
MKRYAYIVRHAKAEDGGFMTRDFDRQLTDTGRLDAALIGQWLAEQHLKPDYMVSSLAARAIQTAQLMATALGFDPKAIKTTRSLYDEGPNAYLQAINEAPEDCEHLMIFGHNPDISYFAEYLADKPIGSMSKGAVAIIEFEGLAWNEISAHTGRLKVYKTPKELRTR